MPFAKPLLVVSRCLGFAACRYNGVSLPNEVVNRLLPFVEVLTPCPESDIGLPTPATRCVLSWKTGKSICINRRRERTTPRRCIPIWTA